MKTRRVHQRGLSIESFTDPRSSRLSRIHRLNPDGRSLSALYGRFLVHQPGRGKFSCRGKLLRRQMIKVTSGQTERGDLQRRSRLSRAPLSLFHSRGRKSGGHIPGGSSYTHVYRETRGAYTRERARWSAVRVHSYNRGWSLIIETLRVRYIH